MNKANSLKIISVRSTLTTTLPIYNVKKTSNENIEDVCHQLRNKNLIVECNKYEWHVMCKNNCDTEDKHMYESISESTLSEIVSSSNVFNWKIESHVLNQLISNGELQPALEQDDKLDVSYENI